MAGVLEAEEEGKDAEGSKDPAENLEEDDEEQQQAQVLVKNVILAAGTPLHTAAVAELTADRGEAAGETKLAAAPHAATEDSADAAEAQALAAARTASIPPVQVCVRVRPLLPWERNEGHERTALEIQDGPDGAVTLRPKDGPGSAADARGFRFNAVFGPEQSQQDMWDMARVDTLVGRVADGFHATIFAYGQTGSGKTHTMEGYNYNHNNGSAAPSSSAGRSKVKVKGTSPDQLGIVPRAVQRLFVHAEALIAQHRSQGTAEESFVIKVSFLQIYKEKIFDLLNVSHTPAQRESGKGDDYAGLRMRWDATKRQFFVENLFEYECSTADEVLQHYANGVQNKHVASTAMNVASSRSHTVLVLTLVRTIGAVASPDNPSAPVHVAKEVVSKLALVDLAGSERASSNSSNSSAPSERGGARFQEAVNINQSLFVLRKVITALAKRPKGAPLPSARGHGHHAQQGHSGDVHHIPYRESKLTSLLQHAIGGNSYLLMVACLSPSDKHHEENLSTLQYASQAACIKNEPIMNVDPKDRLIEHLKAQLTAAHRYILRITGLGELPEEILVAAPASTNRRGSQGLQRRTFSLPLEGPTPSAPASGTPRAQRTRSSDFRSPLREQRHDLGHSKPGVLHLTSESVVEEAARGSDDFGDGETPTTGAARPPSHSSSPDSSAVPITPDHSPVQPEVGACPAADLLLAAGSAYRPPAAGSRPQMPGAQARLPVSAFGRPPGASPPTSMTARSSDSDKTAKCNLSKPPSLPSAPILPWGNYALPPISAPIFPFSSSATASSPKASAPSGVESYGVYGEVRSGANRRRRRGGSQPVRVQTTPRSSDSMEGCGTGQEQVSGNCSTESAAAAVDNGLWDAVEELRIAKRGLEDKLKGAEMREGALRSQLQHAEADAITAQQSRGCGREHSSVVVESLVRSENEALRGSIALLEERLKSARPDEKTVREEEARSLDTLRDTMRSENEALRRESKAFQERLEVFEKALALESPKHKTMGDLVEDGESTLCTAKLGERLEKLHSNFVLELVGLRKEVAGLKKKKWVLRSVLASGGETERLAIENDLNELRKSGGGSGFKSASESKGAVCEMILTR